MPLNWYISEVEDWDNYCFEPAPENPKEERMTPLTNQLINMTMAVGPSVSIWARLGAY